MSTGPVELQGITINAGILETLQGFSTNRNVLKGITIAVGTGAQIMQLKVVDRNHEPIEGATCRVLNTPPPFVLSFDGIDDKVEMGDAFDLRTGSLSYEFWMNTTRTTGLIGVIGKTRAAGMVGRWAFLFENNQAIALLHMPSGIRNITFPTSAISLNTWHHIGISIDRATNMKVYLDGVLVGTSASIASDSAADLNITDVFGIGGYQNNAGTAITQAFFPGRLSEVRIWNTVRSQTDFQNNRNIRTNGNEPGLIGYYPLNEGSGTTANNIIGGSNGTITGATWGQVTNLPIGPPIINYEPIPFDTGTTNANGLTTLNYQINKIHDLEVTLPGKRRFIMPFERTTRGLLDWQVMLSDYLTTFATDRGNILINSEPENNDANFLIE